MIGDETKNESKSAGTSGSGPLRGEPRSEAEYLQHQAADAQAAMQQTLDDLRESLKTAADVRLWTQQHPWASVATAAAMGFAAASAVAASWRVAAKPMEEPCEPVRPGSTSAPASQPAGKSTAHRLVGFLFDLAKESLAAFAASAIRPNMDGGPRHPASPV